MMDNTIFIGQGEGPVSLLAKYANRHGLIAGATGTGKTVTLQVLAEGFSRMGVPVFLADVKGDVSGMAMPGGGNPKVEERASAMGLAPMAYEGSPVLFWDVFGEQGHPVRTTISEMGPLILSRLLSLNDTQEGVLNIAFRVADEEGLLLLDLKDLRAMLAFIAEHAQELTREYGNVSSASVGAIQRALLVIEEQGGDNFFGEPALNIQDLMRTALDGRGYVSILAADRLFQSPRLYATFLLFLLSELFEDLPEVGDLEKPKLVFFFDEAHLLFDDAPDALQEKVEQVVRLIRSKGVGVYFVTQNPLDIPDPVLGQLGNRVQHALRAFTPRDQKAVRTAAETFRQNPNFSTEDAILQLTVGEALVSVLEEKGAPSVVQRTLIRPPSSRIGPATKEERAAVQTRSPLGSAYDQTTDRDSAYERLQAKAEAAAQADAQAKEEALRQKEAERAERDARRAGSGRQGYLESVAKSALRSAGSSIGSRIVRGILGSLFGKRR
jgi:DNA helicase HerA-like ATPase